MNKQIRFLIASIVIAIALPLNAVAAQPDSKKIPTAFSTFDRNRDGKITLIEYTTTMKNSPGEATAPSRFASLDQNGDGTLSKDEFAAGAEKKTKKKKET
jgi:Ca2+-binding EF-hand superfamily protein